MSVQMSHGLNAKTDRLVPVGQAANGLACGLLCPNCEKPLIAKNAGRKREHHFAHAHVADNCGEGWLHATAKRILWERQQSALAKGRRVSIAWPCHECPCGIHKGNLVKGVARVEIERTSQDANVRPDLTAFDGNGQPLSYQEIVVSHEPDPAVFEHCQQAGVPLVVFKVGDKSDLERLEKLELRPTHVFHRIICRCLRDNRCSECGYRLCEHYHCSDCQNAVFGCKGPGLCRTCEIARQQAFDRLWLHGTDKEWNDHLVKLRREAVR